MNNEKKILIVIVTLSGALISFGVIIFISIFGKGKFSNDIADWGNFGGYINGIITPVLSMLNIYIFYMISNIASRLDKMNVIKQLRHETCKEYQNKINEIIFQLLENIEIYKETKDVKYFQRAKLRLSWLQYYVDSFFKEAIPLLEQVVTVNSVKQELDQAATDLRNSGFSDQQTMQNFIDKKSKFIRTIFENMIK